MESEREGGRKAATRGRRATAAQQQQQQQARATVTLADYVRQWEGQQAATEARPQATASLDALLNSTHVLVRSVSNAGASSGTASSDPAVPPQGHAQDVAAAVTATPGTTMSEVIVVAAASSPSLRVPGEQDSILGTPLGRRSRTLCTALGTPPHLRP